MFSSFTIVMCPGGHSRSSSAGVEVSVNTEQCWCEGPRELLCNSTGVKAPLPIVRGQLPVMTANSCPPKNPPGTGTHQALAPTRHWHPQALAPTRHCAEHLVAGRSKSALRTTFGCCFHDQHTDAHRDWWTMSVSAGVAAGVMCGC
jgi:hypothetical protein